VAFFASWRIGLFFVLFGIALWFYSHKLSKQVFIGEFAASLLAVTAFFSLILYYHTISFLALLYGYSLFMVLFSREVHKAIKSMKGDIVFGYKSIATTIGIVPSIRLFQVLILVSIISDTFLIYMMGKAEIIGLLILISLLKLITVGIVAKDVVGRKKWAKRLLQLIIAIYILGIAWL
jgi:4-hydroxybenzoate polyprenyltransferase